MGADAVARLSRQAHQDHLGRRHIIGVLQQLLHDLAAALAHAQRAQRAVAGVAVRAQHHFAAARQHLPGVLVDHRLVGGHIVAAIFHRRRQAEGVVVGVDRAAHGAQAVVAVGQHIGHGKALHAAGLGRLDHAHIGDVVGDQAVEGQVQQPVLSAPMMLAQDLIGHGLFPVSRHSLRCFRHRAAVPYHAAAVQLDHILTPFRRIIMGNSIPQVFRNATEKSKFLQVVFLVHAKLS